jgi:sporulation protein YlmC with PRC-barrel domain
MRTTKITQVLSLAAALTVLPAMAQNQNNENQNQNNENPNQLGTVERANQVYGKEVISSDNQKIGKLNNLVVDLESGRILYATIGATGDRLAVVPEIFAKTPAQNAKNVRVNVTKQKIEGAPKFTGNEDKPEELGNAAFIAKVYQYFGVNPWWQGSQPADVGYFHNVHKVNKITGMNVLDVNNNKIATVHNTAVDLPAGRVVFVILDPAASLNAGNNLYVLPPQAVTLSQDHENLVTGVNHEKLLAAPHFTKGNWPNLSDQNFASQVYTYFGKRAYFNTDNLAPTGR